MNWMYWIRANWRALVGGKKLFVAAHLLGHPRYYPHLFTRGSGWPVGQYCDYMMQLTDRSRIHVQCFAAEDGMPMLRVHRDRWDPDCGPVEYILHGFFETPVGLVTVGTTAIIALIELSRE